MKTGALAVLALLVSWSGPALAGTWSYGGEAGFEHDSNVTNAGSPDDEETSERIGLGASATYTIPFGLFSALQLRGGLDGAADLQFDKLSFVRAAARARLLCKPGEGFYAPVLAAWGSAGVREFGSALRDSADYRGGLYLQEALTTTVQARVEAMLSRRESSSRVFDLDERSYAGSVDWAVAPWLTLYGEYRWTTGGLVVSAEGAGVTPKSEHLYLNAYAEAIEPDDAFGQDWNAFRVEADTQIASFGANLPLPGGLALDAQLQSAKSEADLGDGSIYGYGSSFSYDRWIGSVSVLARF